MTSEPITEELVRWMMRDVYGDVEAVPPAPPWMDAAACAGHPTEWWFPGRGGQPDEALRICGACPVRQECLADVLEWEGDAARIYRHGLWAGLTPGQRADGAGLDDARRPACACGDCGTCKSRVRSRRARERRSEAA